MSLLSVAATLLASGALLGLVQRRIPMSERTRAILLAAACAAAFVWLLSGWGIRHPPERREPPSSQEQVMATDAPPETDARLSTRP